MPAPFKLGNRAVQTTISTGLGDVSLIAPAAGVQSIVASVGDGTPTAVQVEDPNTGDWELFLTTATAGVGGGADKCPRGALIESNTGAHVDFQPGVKTVAIVPIAQLMIYLAAIPAYADGQILQRVAGAWVPQTLSQVIAGIGPLSGRNRIVNGNFQFNQRMNVSAAVLAAGKYGHDRWKAGAAGGDYSFVQAASDTQITIAAGKTLIQVVKDANVEGGNYMLSWTGTSQARVGTNGAAAAGAYAVSPIAIVGAPAGKTISVEFDAGTLGLVQLEPGTVVTPFERQDYAVMYERCRHHCRLIGDPASASTVFGVGHAIGGQTVAIGIQYPGMHAAPTITVKNISSIGLYNADHSGLYYCDTAIPAGAAVDCARVEFHTAQGGVVNLNPGQACDILSNIAPHGYILLEAEI